MAHGERMRTDLHSCIKIESFLAALVSVALLSQVRPASEKRRLAPQNSEVLGITLGESEFADLERILGSRTASDVREQEGVLACYCSSGDERTVLQFDTWIGTVVEFHFFKGSRQLVSRCTKSKLISDSLATSSGLRLGMSRAQVIALLGTPAKNGEDRLRYELDYNRPPTPEELKRFKDAFAEPPALMNVYGNIDLRFRNGKVVRVDALRGEDY